MKESPRFPERIDRSMPATSPSLFRGPKAWFRRRLTELRRRLRPAVPWVAVLGPDGSGKSSVLDVLERRFREKADVRTVRGYWRPGVLLPWEDEGPNTNPHGEDPRGPVVSAVKVFFLMTDWLLGYWTHGGYADQRARRRLVLFDRHYLDLLVDPRRYRFERPMWLARWAARFVPTPDILVVLDAPAEVLQQRKQEVSFEQTARLRVGYRALAARLPNAHVVDAAQPLDAVVDRVEHLILDHADAPILKGPLPKQSKDSTT